MNIDKDEIIRMAREAGILSEFDTAQDIIECGIEVWLSGERGFQTLERLVKAAYAAGAAAERESCAKLCEEMPWISGQPIPSNREFARTIRARGQT